MTTAGALVLAGGGHSHALLLKQWAMRPKRRPNRRIVLVNRHGSALYSGMVPALIAGIDRSDVVEIDLRQLCDRAGVAFIQAEISGVDVQRQQLQLTNRPALTYGLLSLNVGAVSRSSNADGMAIKPLEPALAFLAAQEPNSRTPFRVVGAGSAGVEVVLALRRRWPQRPLQLQSHPNQLNKLERHILSAADIELTEGDAGDSSLPLLLCTGSRAPSWLGASELPVEPDGRVRTDRYLQVQGATNIFAAGDCAVVANAPRPASGVWAVRAAQPLAHNLEARCSNQTLRPWRPQHLALQLIGDQQGRAWARWGPWQLGPSSFLWQWKRHIDQRFMEGFRSAGAMDPETPMACRGCAAKLAAQPLEAALQQVGLGGAPEDAALIEGDPPLLQSVDGFPALLSDPWMNGRLTTLHASSDLWACGTSVHSAQAVVTLPLLDGHEQQELLAQTLAGVRSVLEEQGASLIGGHTLEARSASPQPAELGLQLTLCVNGRSHHPWSKGGIQAGDALLMSRPLGTGVLFAAAMAGATSASALDGVIGVMSCSQHHLLDQLRPHRDSIHACTDITGFGLLGHLGEMLLSSPTLRVTLLSHGIPSYPHALNLLEHGHASSLAPANRRSWRLLDHMVQLDQPPSRGLMELLVDPQTCGPLLLACPETTATQLLREGPWHRIGTAATGHS